MSPYRRRRIYTSENLDGWKRAWFYHSVHIGELIYYPQSGLDLKWIRYEDDVGHPERVLRITEQLRDTRKPLEPGPSFALSTHF